MSEGGERTEEATPKRRADARKQGQVLRSTELPTAVALIGGAWLLQWAGPQMAGTLLELTRRTFAAAAGAGTADLSSPALQQRGLDLLGTYAGLVAPLLFGLCALGIVVQVGQTGLFFSGGLVKPQCKRVNPMAGMQRLLSARTAVESLKTVAKLAVVGYVTWTAAREHGERLTLLALMPPAAAGGTIVGAATDVIWRAIYAFVVIAGLDYGYARWSHGRSLRMTRDELKQEMKESEGNPEIKARLRQRARALAKGRMMQDVPKADVVLANPTHYAVALRYEPGEAAPQVLALGADLIAQQIKKVAREHGVPVVENKPLAQALFKATAVGQSVPPELYKAVAEVLAFVYRMRAGNRPGLTPRPAGG